MRLLDRIGRRGAYALTAALAAAAIGGTAFAVLASRDDGAPNALVPVNPAGVPFGAAPTSASAAPDEPSPTPAATRSAAPSRTPSPTPSPTPAYTPSPTPARTAAPTTVAPTTTAPATPRPDPGMALVLIDNRSEVDARVGINGGHWFVPKHTHKTVQVRPEPALHDEIDVADADHDGCGMADGGYPYFAPDRSFTLAITPIKNCYAGGGPEPVDSLTWEVTPPVRH